MARVLHVLTADAPALAAPAIAAGAGAPGARVTVVLLGVAAPDGLPGEVIVRRLAPGDLDYPELLDLIFAADHVVAW
jgi:hypothetical protein